MDGGGAAATATATTTTTTPTMTGVTKARLRRGRRLILVLLPLQGHLSPMLQLGEILHSQGFSTTIIYPSFDGSTIPILSNHPNLEFAPIFVPLPEGAPVDDHIGMLLVKNAVTVEPLAAKLRTLLSESSSPSSSEEEDVITCMISDPLLFASREAARKVGLPNVALWTGSSSCFRVYAAFPMLREKGYFPPGGDLRSEEEVAELPPFRVRDLPSFPNCNPESIYELITRMVEHVTSCKALLVNTFESLEPIETASIRESLLLPHPVFPVGPLHKLSPGSSATSLLPQDHTCIHWLDHLETPPRSVLYVSFGSSTFLSRDELEEMAWGLAASRQYFLWVLRPGSILGEEMEEGCSSSSSALLPEGFPEETKGRGCVVGWAPQKEVLRHPRVGGFWTHCGWNSTMESLCEGVPMICRSYIADQTLNSRVVEDVWKVGIAMGKVAKREEVEKVVRKLMVEEEGSEMRARAMDLKARAALSIDRGRRRRRESVVGSSWWHLEKFAQFASSL